MHTHITRSKLPSNQPTAQACIGQPWTGTVLSTVPTHIAYFRYPALRPRDSCRRDCICGASGMDASQMSAQSPGDAPHTPRPDSLGRGRGVGVEEGWMRCRLHECSWPGTGWPMDEGCVNRVARVILVSVGVLVASVRACVMLYVYHCVRVCGETGDGKCL